LKVESADVLEALRNGAVMPDLIRHPGFSARSGEPWIKDVQVRRLGCWIPASAGMET
jgi:hypothetical protein